MRPGARLAALLLSSFLVACGTIGSPPKQAAPAPQPFVLITAAPNASPTATAFLPPAPGQPTPTSLYYAPVATLEAALPTATASPTNEPPAEPTPTVDIAALFPTSAAPPPPSGIADAPAPLPSLTDSDAINFLLI